MEYLLETRNLSKRFGSTLALDRVNLHLRPGDIYGFIGKNGAGKTTAMKIILGFLEPSEGEVIVRGRPLKEARRNMGSLIESPGLFEQESAKENLRRFALLTGDGEEKLDELLAFVGLGEVGKKKVKAFSLGMKQRLGVAIALLGDPDILILDEPMNALDPGAIKDLRDLFARIAAEKKTTIMIASHILDELSKIATVYGIIREGRLVEEVRVEELERLGKEGLRIEVSDLEAAKRALREAGFFGAEDEARGSTLLLKTPGLRFADFAPVLLSAQVEVLSFAPEKRETIEEYFIERIGK